MHNYVHGGISALCDINDEDADNDGNEMTLHLYND